MQPGNQCKTFQRKNTQRFQGLFVFHHPLNESADQEQLLSPKRLVDQPDLPLLPHTRLYCHMLAALTVRGFSAATGNTRSRFLAEHHLYGTFPACPVCHFDLFMKSCFLLLLHTHTHAFRFQNGPTSPRCTIIGFGQKALRNRT